MLLFFFLLNDLNVNIKSRFVCSRLVIIDFEKAIEYGFVKVAEKLKDQYLNEYGE